jgi:leucyl-tRNA---protein transferase
MFPRLADHVFMYKLSPVKLDRLLAAGYFRNANIMFQSQVLCLEGKLCDVVNIRLPLQGYKPPRRIAKLAAKAEAQFKITIGKAQVTPQKEALYYLHRQRFKGFQYKNLSQMLYGESPVRIFDTYEINIFDGEELVAYSYFDVGKNSIASILGVFDERYKKFSLGIYSMYAEVQFALEHGYQYYYPGYVLAGVPQFDYKLQLGRHEYFIWSEKRWGEADEMHGVERAGNILMQSLQKIAALFDRAEIKYQYKLYPFFSLGYLSLSNYQFYVRSPQHLLLTDLSHGGKYIIVEYDTEEQRYVCGTARVNEAYQDYLKVNGGLQRPTHEHEWPTVLEYHALVKFNSAEALVRDVLQNYF